MKSKNWKKKVTWMVAIVLWIALGWLVYIFWNEPSYLKEYPQPTKKQRKVDNPHGTTFSGKPGIEVAPGVVAPYGEDMEPGF